VRLYKFVIFVLVEPMLSYCCRIFSTNICNLLSTWSSPRLDAGTRLFICVMYVSMCLDSGRLNYVPGPGTNDVSLQTIQ
jgi:hypothetical protein